MIKHMYRVVPRPLRRTSPVHRLAVRVMEKIGDCDDIYSPRYYQTMVEPYAQRSALPMAESIVETFHPKSVVDVGCGSGALLVALRKLGVRQSLGLDSSDAGLNIANARGLTTRRFDITTGRWACTKCFDVAVSMETAEHLPEDAADRYIALLCSLAPIVVFTAAQPGQGGIGHINEQPRQYWVDQFLACGMHPADELVAVWQPVWTAAGVANFYTRNLMIFQSSSLANPA
jgi:trans-aconitate methyltransferase